MFTLTQGLERVACAAAVLAFSAPTIQDVAFAQEPIAEKSVKVDDLSLRVAISSSFEKNHPSTKRLKTDICDNFFRHLKVDQGPWGFGLFQKSEGCEIVSGSKSASGPLLWTLNVSVNEQNQGTLALCRPYSDDTEKCEASVTMPTSRLLPELLADESYSRLLAAALLDQTPFRSKLTAALVKPDGSYGPKDESPQESAFPVPPRPSQNRLLAISAEILLPQSMFRVAIQKDPPATLLSQQNIWLITLERGAMREILSTKISEATETLGTKLQAEAERDAKAGTILGRKARQQAKAGREFLRRTDSSLETRAGGTVVSGDDFAMSGDVQALFANSTFWNLWTEASLQYARYHFELEVQPRSRRAITSATRTEGLFSVGLGLRWSSDSDHTFFAYPRLEAGHVKWDVEIPIEKLPSDSYRSSTTSVGNLGAAFGYESPEDQSVRLKAQVTGTGLLKSNTLSLKAELSCYFDAFDPLTTLSAMLGANRSEVLIYGFANRNFLESSSKYFKLVEFQLNNIGLGLGFRWMWL